jgi:hypothetical protein
VPRGFGKTRTIAALFETGANLIPSATEKATTVNEDYVLRSPNQ